MKIALSSLFTAWFIGMVTAPIVIPVLRRLKFGQRVRSDGPAGHLKKAGTPTMGGIIFIIALLGAAALWSSWSKESMLLMGMLVGFGTLGFLDDFIKIVLKRPLGLKAREKILGQLLLSLILIVISQGLGRGTDLIIPLTGTEIELGAFYYLMVIVLVLGTSNGVNLTDGLDGLATGCTFFVLLGFMAIGLWGVQSAPIPGINYGDLAIFAASLAGGCLAFLFYNHFPAKVFMGDTGSLALGGAVAALAVLTKTELVLPIIGIIYVIESLSVMIQVVSFRLTGRRVFRMSPLHHHFELVGWHEKKVVYSFWIVSALGVLAGLLLII